MKMLNFSRHYIYTGVRMKLYSNSYNNDVWIVVTHLATLNFNMFNIGKFLNENIIL